MQKTLTLLLLLLSAEICFADTVKITIDRKYVGEQCTAGYLIVNGTAICYTLELPPVDNINAISSVPAGTYTAFLRYDKNDKWRLQLVNVYGREGIQIHVGNKTNQTQGCILLGDEMADDICEIKPGTSRTAYRKFKEACYGDNEALPELGVVVTITDPQP